MEQNTKSSIRKYAQLSVLYVSGPIFIVLTNPDSLPLPLLVVPFIWVFAVVALTIYWLLGKYGFSKKRSTILSIAIAVFTVLLAVFQSIHQLTIRDVLLSAGLVVFMTIYMSRADFLN